MNSRFEVIAQLFQMLWSRRGWWLAPVVMGLLIVGALAALASASSLSPFIYPLF